MIDTELGVSIDRDDLAKLKTLGHIIDELKSRGALE